MNHERYLLQRTYYSYRQLSQDAAAQGTMKLFSSGGSNMRVATELLIDYAQHHRDHRNIVTHLLGIPAVVFSAGVLFARPSFWVGTVALNPAWLMFVAAAVWYVTRGGMVLGVAVSAGIAALLVLAQQIAGGSLAAWLAWGLGAFALGRLIQFLGHCYEGPKEHVQGNLQSWLVGPMFVTAQVLFAFGWNKPLLAEIERRAGPVVLRDMTRIA
jgi:uncharacterized membrane protein YGL010W